jgi:hypothetical protein
MKIITISDIIKQLENNQQVFESLLINKATEEYLWRSQPGKWNLLEVVCHLYDEEHEDFIARIKQIFEYPLKEMTPIDPEGWVLKRNYAQQLK